MLLILLAPWILFCFKIAFAKNVSVYVHIGPHKTGSTSLQDFLSQRDLRKVGLCWPGPRLDRKELSLVPLTILSSNQYPIEHVHTLENCLRANLSIVMSAEDFSTLSQKKIRLFEQTVIQAGKKIGHNISFKIIFFYREFLTKLYSYYPEVHRKNLAKTLSFYHYALRQVDIGSFLYHFDSKTVMNRFVDVFGKEKITIIDYDGLKAARQDVVQVFLCSILKVFCNEKITVPVQNEKPNMIHLNLLHLVNLEVQARNGRLCGYDDLTDLMTSYPALTKMMQIPIRQASLKPLLPHFRHLDREFRKAFGNLMLYNNVTASMEALRALQIKEIDEVAFYGPDWLKFVSSELDRLSKEGKICDSAGKKLNLTYAKVCFSKACLL